MKRYKHCSIILLIFTLFLGNCSTASDEFKICANPCPKAEPWRVESLDLGLPCFTSQNLCLEWAKTHGYSDKPCVRCDQ